MINLIFFMEVIPINSYYIDKQDDSLYNYIIYSTSYISPIENIKEIEQELAKLAKVPVNVLFDLFLTVGNSSNRYIKVYFNGINFERDSFKEIEISKKDEIRSISTAYYQKNEFLLKNSVLNNAQKFLIRKGIVI